MLMHFVSAFIVKHLIHKICAGNHKKPNQNLNPRDWQNLHVIGSQTDISHKNYDLLWLMETQQPSCGLPIAASLRQE